jgi:hypothetical protein
VLVQDDRVNDVGLDLQGAQVLLGGGGVGEGQGRGAAGADQLRQGGELLVHHLAQLQGLLGE